MTALDYRSAAAPADEKTERRRGHWLLWAIYLAMSWTWCIGMFLPVLLVPRFGVWGWVVFAIPNVVGAAAVGWVNGTTEKSRDTVAAHAASMCGFSFVTAAFQIFFAMWWLPWLGHSHLIPVVIVFALALMVLPDGSRRSHVIAAVVFGASLACWIEAERRNAGLVRFSELLVGLRFRPPLGLLPLVGLACCTGFGFLLCPNLDITFHRARERLSYDASRLAFGVGFGGPFLAMIVFSLLYAGGLSNYLDLHDSYLSDLLISWLAVHFTIQLGFTVGVHWQAQWQLARLRGVTVAAGSFVVGALAWWAMRFRYVERMNSGELIYRLFMSFYGLVFPAYVWLCMIPGRWVTPPTRRQLIAWGVAVMIAAPMFWMAFIRGHMVWAVPGVCVVLLSRLGVGRTPRATLA